MGWVNPTVTSRFDSPDGFRGLLGSDSSLMLIAHGCNILTGLAVTVIATRVLETEILADLLWAVSTSSWLATVALLGTDRFVLKHLASSDNTDSWSAFTDVALIALCGTALVCSTWWVSMELGFAPGDSISATLVLVTLAWVVVWGTYRLVESTSRSLGRFRDAALLADATRRCVLILMLVVPASLSLNLSLTSIIGLSVVVEVLLLAVIGRQTLASLRPRRRRPDLPNRQSFARSTVFLGGSLFSAVLPQAGVSIASAVGTSAATANFAIAVRLSFLANLVMFVGAKVLGPQIASAKNIKAIEPRLRRFSAIALATNVAIAATIAVLGRPMIRLLVGDTYLDSWAPLIVLLVGQLLVSATGLCGKCLTYTDSANFVALLSLASSLAFAFSAIVLGERWGATGIAVAASAVVTVHNLVMAWQVRRRLGIRTYPVLPIFGAEVR